MAKITASVTVREALDNVEAGFYNDGAPAILCTLVRRFTKMEK